MFKRLICFVLLVAGAVALSSLGAARAADDGIVKLRSAYPMPETIARMKKDIADKGIKFFDEIDQAKLAADAGITLLPSTLLVFGNPPLGTLFITADPDSGLDWPVRVLVYQDAKGDVWVAYTDFEWIRKRHGIANRDKEFKMASEVIGSITSTVKGMRGICCFSHQHRRRTCQHRIGRGWHHALCMPRRRPPDCACQLSLLAIARSPDVRLTDGFNQRFRYEASIGVLTAPRAVLLHTNQFPRGP